MTATYTKLRDQSWGIRVAGTVSAGQTVAVTKRDGSSKTETIGRVLWTDGAVCLCSIATTGAGRRQSTVERTYRRKYGWDGVRGSTSYYSSGMYDEES